MWSRSTKQRRAAMRRRHTGAMLAGIQDARRRRGLVGPMSKWTAARVVEIQAEVNGIQRSIARRSTAPFRTLVYAETPKETK